MPLCWADRRVFLLLLLAAAAAESNTNTSTTNCTHHDGETVRAAFIQVTNFPFPLPGRRRACRPVRRLHFPSRNLTGAVDWAALGNLTSLLTVDLSNNSLHGRIDAAFWRAPSLRAVDVSGNRLDGVLRFGFGYPSNTTRLASLNVSGNRFTAVEGLAGALSGVLVELDVSRNVIGSVPEGLRNLTRLRVLNLSGNHMTGTFPDDLPPLEGIQVLDVSYNNFSGEVDVDTVVKFGRSSFVQAGTALRVIEDHIAPAPAPSSSSSNGGDNKHGLTLTTIVLISIGAAAVTAAAFVSACVFLTTRRRRRRKKKNDKKDVWEDDEVVVGAAKVAAGAAVVVVERPLMELTLADLAAATSGFGRESQLAESTTGGRSGPAYRAVLPGDLHVVVRVVQGAVAGVAEDADAAATEAGFRELARLRHPNILPLLGYCIAGGQKLVLYEYMEKGDLHRWLHELPVGSMDTEDICMDTMEALEDTSRKPAGDWPTRYRIILGIARGLAFLHQGWSGSGAGAHRPVVHGRLVPTNILLGDDMEPRISDFLSSSSSGNEETATVESDVYRFGTLVFEVVTGQARWGDVATTSWARGVIRNRKGLNLVDDRLLRDETTESEIAECLQVGFLCTATSPEKRPTMQQVVGLLKDVRPLLAVTNAGAVETLAVGSSSSSSAPHDVV